MSKKNNRDSITGEQGWDVAKVLSGGWCCYLTVRPPQQGDSGLHWVFSHQFSSSDQSRNHLCAKCDRNRGHIETLVPFGDRSGFISTKRNMFCGKIGKLAANKDIVRTKAQPARPGGGEGDGGWTGVSQHCWLKEKRHVGDKEQPGQVCGGKICAGKITWQ